MMILALIFLAYLVPGLLFALAFVLRGYRVVDQAAITSGGIFRFMIFPAAALLWPYLAIKWRRAAS